MRQMIEAKLAVSNFAVNGVAIVQFGPAGLFGFSADVIADDRDKYLRFDDALRQAGLMPDITRIFHGDGKMQVEMKIDVPENWRSLPEGLRRLDEDPQILGESSLKVDCTLTNISTSI